MRISELAKQANVHIQTLRFYEREGLLAKPPRTSSGYRSYEQRDLDRVRFIRSCQEIGFTLAEVREVLQLHRILAAREGAGNLKPDAQRTFLATATRRLSVIDEKLRLLRKMKRDMESLVATLGGTRKPVCPVSGLPWG